MTLSSERQAEFKLGTFMDNSRRHSTKLSTQRRAGLDALGMRW
ncbi:hypothetical protein ACWDSD_32670 [Streptomyces spiralis]